MNNLSGIGDADCKTPFPKIHHVVEVNGYVMFRSDAQNPVGAIISAGRGVVEVFRHKEHQQKCFGAR